MIFLKKHLDIVRENEIERKKIHKECNITGNYEPYYSFIKKQIQGVPKEVLENYGWCFLNENNKTEMIDTRCSDEIKNKNRLKSNYIETEIYTLLENGDVEYKKLVDNKKIKLYQGNILTPKIKQYEN
jgi:hypothetical protein